MNLSNHILIGAGIGVAIYFLFFNKSGKSNMAGASQVLIPGSNIGLGGDSSFVVKPGGGLANIGVPYPGSQLAQENADVVNSFMAGSTY